jgi:hypothetical protein
VEDTEDWGAVEGGVSRWTDSNYARFYVWTATERSVHARFNLVSFGEPRHVAVTFNGLTEGEQMVPQSGAQFNLDVEAVPGVSTFLLSIGGKPISPLALGISTDPRLLTVSLSNCSFEPR